MQADYFDITIYSVRNKLKLTQKQFAPLMGMTQQAISRIETGYEWRLETKINLAALTAIVILHENGLIDELLLKLRIPK
jgi:DNA-binding XRE family transcriptional regulator